MTQIADVRTIALELIDEPAEAMRSDIPRDEVFELAADIKQNGLINPITVRPRGERFEVVAGHRRFLAHRYGGIPLIRCIVRDLSDDEAFAVMTSENLKRENVNPVDEATHTARLFKMHNGDIGRVCKIVGYGESWVKSRLAVAEMPDNLKGALRDGKVSLGVALALTEITNETDRDACLEMAITQGASVTMVRYWVAQWQAGLFGSALLAKISDPNNPGHDKHVVMLRCAVDGKEYPANQMTSVLVRQENVGYIDAIREHLEREASAVPSSPVAEPVAATS